MKSLLLAFAILFTLKGFSQNFDEKPYTFIEKQVLNNLKKSEVKNNLPTGYAIALEESDKVIAEKAVNGKTYDIQYFYKDGNLISISFTQHSERVWKLMPEMSALNYKVVNNMVLNNVETTIYSKESLKLGGLMICNDDTRILTGSITKMK